MRQLHQISDLELRRFSRKGSPVHQAWEDVADHLYRRDPRGVKKWVFVLGWLAATAYYRKAMTDLVTKLEANQQQELNRLQENWRKQSGLGLLD